MSSFVLLMVEVAHAGGAYDQEAAEPAFWLATAIVVLIAWAVIWMWIDTRRDGGGSSDS